MNEINQLMDEELIGELKDLKKIRSGSEEQTTAVANLTTLYRARIEGDKIQNEARKCEAEREDQKIDRLIRVGTALVEIGLPLVCYGHWFQKGLKFEETGSITSSMMRNLINKFKTKK